MTVKPKTFKGLFKYEITPRGGSENPPKKREDRL